MTSNLTMHKGEFHYWRQSIRRVFKQMAKMGASGRELIVLADESERRRVPSSPTFISLLISRRGRSWMSVGLEFPTLRDENCHHLFIKSKVFYFYLKSFLLFFRARFAALGRLFGSPRLPTPFTPPICRPRPH